MLKKEFIEMMKQDEELKELKKKVIEITGKRESVVFHIGANYTYEEWKEQLRKIVRKHDTISQ